MPSYKTDTIGTIKQVGPGSKGPELEGACSNLSRYTEYPEGSRCFLQSLRALACVASHRRPRPPPFVFLASICALVAVC